MMAVCTVHSQLAAKLLQSRFNELKPAHAIGTALFVGFFSSFSTIDIVAAVIRFSIILSVT